MKNLGKIFTSKSRMIYILLTVLILFPFIVRNRYYVHILILSMIYGIVASNWDLNFGYFGILNFCHVAIFISGGYVAGILSKSYGVSPWISIIIASFFCAILGSIVALPMLRVKGLYVVLVTFGFSQLLYYFVLTQRSLTGGSIGLSAIPHIPFGNYFFDQNYRIACYFLTLLILIISTLFLTRLVKSYIGKSFVALKDYEAYAISRGVNFGKQLILCFAASSFFTGSAGAIMAFYLTSLSPELLGFNTIVTVISMLIVGGTSTIYGPIIGALVLTIISEFLVKTGALRYIIIGSLIIITLRFFPKGIWPAILNLKKLKIISKWQ